MPSFAFFGLLGLLLLYAAVVFMGAAKRQNKPRLWGVHTVLGTLAAVSLAIHIVWANLSSGGEIHLLGGIGLAAISGVLGGGYAAGKFGKTRDQRWLSIHWKVELAALVLATCHAVGMILSIAAH